MIRHLDKDYNAALTIAMYHNIAGTALTRGSRSIFKLLCTLSVTIFVQKLETFDLTIDMYKCFISSHNFFSLKATSF